MIRHARIRSTVLAVLATAALAAGMFALSPVGSAYAATQTLIAEQATVTNPVAGQEVTMQVFTGSVDGSFPGGEVDVTVEGTATIVGGPANTANGKTQYTIGTFPVGPIIVDATLTPTSSAYSPVSTRLQVVVVGDSASITPVFPTAPTLGHAVTVGTILVIAAGDTHAPGGVVGFDVGGVSVGSCTPAATGAVRNWSCSATLPAPTRAGPYTVTATFGRSSYYTNATGSVTATVAAAPVSATKPKPAAPVTTSNADASTPAPSPTSSAESTSGQTTTPLAASAKKSAIQSPAGGTASAWPWLFLAALVLLIAAVVGLIVLVRARRTQAGQ